MTVLQNCINRRSNTNCIWLMRQAGRYLPEFRKIRADNQDFIKLCLNENLSSEITVQPLRRFDIDAAIIFSDILLVPFALGQSVKFKKDFGPLLGEIDFNKMSKINEIQFIDKLKPVYNAIKKTKDKVELKNKDLIGFVGAPWTILIYMLNQKSPKNEDIEFNLKDKKLIEDLLEIIVRFLKIHINNQIESGATIIQIFDSWAGLLDEKDYEDFVIKPNKKIQEDLKKKFPSIPIIFFPRNSGYNIFAFIKNIDCDILSLDKEFPKELLNLAKEKKIILQGNLDPQFLIEGGKKLEDEVKKIMIEFSNYDHIFNLSHGILPITPIKNVEKTIEIIRNFNEAKKSY